MITSTDSLPKTYFRYVNRDGSVRETMRSKRATNCLRGATGPFSTSPSRAGVRGRPTNAGALVRRGAKLSAPTDRKSTRLNSSHGYISYAVFCLKKKKKKQEDNYT